MATINLGAIKFNWKGAYNSSTSYAVDDVVSSGGNSYVCIQAHSNQAVGNATAYWNIMSSAGTNGTNGTDISTTLTTQGDILYRDGSGLQRLPKGTAGQVLQMNSGATAPEYGTVSSDCVRLINHDITSNVTGINITGWIDNTTYNGYKICLNRIAMTAEDKFKIHFINNSGSTITSSSYAWLTDHIYLSNSGAASTNQHSGWTDNGFLSTSNNYATDYGKTQVMYVSALDLNTAANTPIMILGSIQREVGGQIDGGDGFAWLKTTDAFTNSSAGFNLDRQASGSFTSGNISVYGLK
jgi:hypothetical protein